MKTLENCFDLKNLKSLFVLSQASMVTDVVSLFTLSKFASSMKIKYTHFPKNTMLSKHHHHFISAKQFQLASAEVVFSIEYRATNMTGDFWYLLSQSIY